MSKEQFQKELYYHMATSAINNLLHSGIISVEEHEKIDGLNRISFPTNLSAITP